MLLAGTVKSFLFGVAIAATVGPIALLILGYGAREGFRVAARAGLGAATADLFYALVAFTAGHLVLPLLFAQATLVGRLASAVLLLFGGMLLWRTLHPDETRAAGGSAARPFTSTFLLTVVNPLTIVAFAGFAAQLPLSGSPLNAAWFSLSLFAGSLAVQTVFAAGGSALRRPAWRRAVSTLSAAGIIVFGIAGLIAARPA